MSTVDSERAEVINLRILEWASIFDSDYKEIVGKKDHLVKLKNQI